MARLREAGAVIIGKAALEEYATCGNYSNDAWGQVWNVFNPSKSAIASSGGSASAVAASLAAGAMGSQTGDSLYGPASAPSLVTLRGTDGLESGTGVMPLVWLTDFGGAMARSVPGSRRHAERRRRRRSRRSGHRCRPTGRSARGLASVLDTHALEGKRIGYIDAAWPTSSGRCARSAPPARPTREKAALQYLVARGRDDRRDGALDRRRHRHAAGAAAAIPGNIRAEGWRQYIDSHPELADAGLHDLDRGRRELLAEEGAVRRGRSEHLRRAPAARLTPAEIQTHRDYRQIARPARRRGWTRGGRRPRASTPSSIPGC